MADFEDAQKPNGGFLEVDGGDDLTLYHVLHRLMAAIFFPDPTSSAPLLRRVKISVADNVPLLRQASKTPPGMWCTGPAVAEPSSSSL